MNLKTAFVVACLFASAFCAAQTAVLAPLPRQCFVDSLSAGKPLAGGLIYSCSAGTSCPGTPLATFTDSTGNRQNFNPVTLDGSGCTSMWLSTGLAYKFVAQNSSGVQEWSADNVTGLASTLTNSIASTTAISFSSTPTFTSLAQNQLFTMTLTGNVTSSNLVMSGITPPGLVSFEITQDGTGGRTFVWPVTMFGPVPVSPCANCTTTENFLWDGSTALLVSAYYNNSGIPILAGTSGQFSNPGVFTNTQQNLYLQSLLNGCNPTTQWNSVFNLPNHATEAGTFCSVVPNGATVFQNNGVGSYIENQNGATTAGVAVFGMATASTTVDGRVWAANFLATDVAGTKSQNLYSAENDCNLQSTTSVCHGLLITGFWKAQPTISAGIEIGPIQQGLGCTTCVWPYGIRFDQGATNAPGLSNAALYFFPVASGTSQVSQGMTFLGSDSGGTQNITAFLNLDVNGNLLLQNSKAGAGLKLPNLQVTTGVTGDGGGFKHKRFGATTPTAASIGSFATNTFSWTTPFADANYTVNCSPIGPTQVGVFSIASFNASGVTVEVVAATAAAASYSGVDCIAVHD